MAVAIRSQNTYASSGAATSHAVPAPGTIVDGDILELGIEYRQTSGVQTITWPTGFTQIDKEDITGSRGIAKAWKRASSESGSYSVGLSESSQMTARIRALSGCKASGSPVNAFLSATNASGATQTAPRPTTTVDGCFISYQTMLNGATTTNWTPPANVTESGEVASSGASNVSGMHAFDTANQATAGQTTQRDFTSANTTSSMPWITVAFEPAAAADISPANPTIEDYSPICARLSAGYTLNSGDENLTVATFAYSTNGTDWTNAAAHDVVSYDRTANTAHIIIGGLTPGEGYFFRVTWSGTGVTITGTNPRYIGSSTSPGTETTMLTYPGERDKLVSGTPQYAGARTSFHWTEHNLVPGASNLADDDYATIAKFDSLFLNLPSNTARQTYNEELRALGIVENIWRYTLAAEIRVDGSGDGITLSSTWLWSDAARDRFNAAKDETWFLHSAEPGTLANRLTRVEDSATKHLLNLANAEVLAFLYEEDKWMEVEYHGTGLATANHRTQHRILDNYFVELDRLELPVADSPVEYANAAAMHAAFDDLTTTLQQSGARVGANVLVNNDTVQAEVEAVGASLDLWWFETIWTSFSGSTPSYRTDAQWVICCETVEAGIAAGKMVSCNGQIVDTSASYSFSADDITQQIFIWASWMLCTDTAREMVTFRAFDSSSDGVRRVRTRAEWDLVTGNPTGARTFDTNGGTLTTPTGCWYRTFENGTLILNITGSSRSYSVAGGGTLAAREAAWVPNAGGAVVLLSVLHNGG